jgi:hypothetical protein
LAYEARLRNEMVRADLDAGGLGLGLLANLRPREDHQACRHEIDALRADGEAVRHQAAQLAEELERSRARIRQLEWQITQGPFIRAAVRRAKRRGARAVTLVGAGELAALIDDALGGEGLHTVAIADNDPARWGTEWRGLRIASVGEALGVRTDVVMVASVAHAPAMRAQVARELRRVGAGTPVVTVTP